MRHATLETGGRDSAKTGEGGWASWTAQALFAWTRTHDEPGKSGTFGYIAAGLLCADVSFTHRALARFWAVGAKASHGNNRLLDACFRVFARCAKKRIFNSFTSFSRWKWFIFRGACPRTPRKLALRPPPQPPLTEILGTPLFPVHCAHWLGLSEKSALHTQLSLVWMW